MKPLKPNYDIAIVGSGYGGAIQAMIARRLGRSVLLLERGDHPRFAIGESTSPLANLLLEQLAERYDLPRLLPLASYGPWQRTYPEVGCGLKRGFTYFQQERGQTYHPAADRSNQLLVSASPNDELADTHWLRAGVDTFLVREAISTGADYFDRVSLDKPIWDNGQAGCRLSGTRHGKHFETRARLLLDATGPRGFLSRALDLPPSEFAGCPQTQSLFSHFTGVRRADSLGFIPAHSSPPYPADDAAVHHVFDGGWMWILRLGDRLTSAGIVVTEPLASELKLSEGPAAWKRSLKRFPSVGQQFDGAKSVRPFTYAPRVAWRTSLAAGPGWAMLPSAAAFVDPLFSTGIPLNLLGIERLSQILDKSWGHDDLDTRLKGYAAQTLQEADSVADFIGACHASLPRFPVFASLSMFYFAAASYSEMARRLGRPHLSGGFLAATHPQFGPQLRRAAHWARELAACPGADTAAFEKFVSEAISCLNVAGLCDARKQNWYGVDLSDVVDGAGKLGLTPNEMSAILKNAPWAQAGVPRAHDYRE